MHPREKRKLEYEQQLMQRYKAMPEIRQITRHRHVPRYILKAKIQERAHIASVRRKIENNRKNSKAGAVRITPESRKSIVREVE